MTTRRLWVAVCVAALVVAGGLVARGGSAGAAFPGSNGLLAFTSGPSGKGTIATISADGTGQIFPVNLEDGEDAAWSPDGTKIAYSHYAGTTWQIWVMNADGSNATQITHVPSGPTGYGGAGRPAWSPDGKMIAYMNSSYDAIWVVNADGSNATQITHADSGQGWLPETIAWSPNGKRIAYDRSGDEIWVMNADGTNPMKLTDGAHPNWSPDGKKIAYDHQLVIWEINADGTHQTQITDGTKGSGIQPAWSPDGKKIAFEAPVGGPYNFEQIWLMDADGSNVQQLFATHEDARDPDWQPVPTLESNMPPIPSTTTTLVPATTVPSTTVAPESVHEAKPATAVNAQPTFTG